MLCLFAVPCLAQEIVMDDIFATMEFPDTWLVLSPQTLSVYEPLLSEAGFDASGMRDRYESDGIVVEAWDEEYKQSMRVMVTTDERSATLFDITRATDTQLRSLRTYYETKSNFTATAYRYQDVAWQTHPQYGRFLFLRYNLVDENKNIVERGVRYFTIRNGMNYFIDWTIPDRRFTNKDLAAFKETLASFGFTALLDAPPLEIPLTADIPAEVSSAQVTLTGTTLGNAALSIFLSDGESEGEVISVGTAQPNGTFSIFFDLPAEGTYQVALVASAPDYADNTLRQTLVFQASLLRVSIDRWPDDPWQEDTFTLTGETLAGASLQLITDKGVVTKKVGNNGRFTFELNTPTEGTYTYTLVVNKGKYTQRRFPFTINRVFTDTEALTRIKKQATTINYNDLKKKLSDHTGKVMRLSGQVADISEGEGVVFIRLMLHRDTKGVWTRPVIIACEELPAVTLGQRATLYGYVDIAYMEQDASGEDVVVPGFTFICMD